jgi:uncharacterized membrane protein
MGKGRIEAFSDGVIAIIITIMVLELRVPGHSPHLDDLRALWPTFLSYVLSFLYVGIYWNNHHHLFHAVRRVSGGIMWANLHLLFWMSLIPFVTGWMGENPFAPVPTALYGVVLLAAALAYWILQVAIVRRHGADSLLARAIGLDFKGSLVSPALYLIAIGCALVSPWLACGLYLSVALMWIVPDKRIERALAAAGESD